MGFLQNVQSSMSSSTRQSISCGGPTRCESTPQRQSISCGGPTRCESTPQRQSISCGGPTRCESTPQRQSISCGGPTRCESTPQRQSISCGGPTRCESGSFIFVARSCKLDEISSAPFTEEPGDQDFYGCTNHKLTYMMSYLFAECLEEAISNITLLMESNNDLRVLAANMDMSYLLARKHQIEEATVQDELSLIDPDKIHDDIYKIKKLKNDRNYICDVLQCLCADMITRMNFRLLVHKCRILTANIEQRNKLFAEYHNTKFIFRDLEKQLRVERNQNLCTVYEVDSEIAELRTLIDDKELSSSQQLRYGKRWQNARIEQHSQKHKDVERTKIKDIRQQKTRWENEYRSHNEIKRLNRMLTEEALQKTDDMMKQYERDMEKIDLDIFTTRCKYDKMVEKRMHLEWTLKHHENLMQKWQKYKNDRQKAAEYSEKMNHSAVIVQAWWRGFMVRKGLGPYRPHTRKAKGKKGKALSTTESQ